METLLQQKGFTKILFDAIPQLALLLDPDCAKKLYADMQKKALTANLIR